MMVSTQSGRILGRVELSEDHGFSRMAEKPVDVVAVSGAIGDWAAYWGERTWSDQDIHQNGLKLYEDEAAALFPYLNQKHYRR